MLARRQQEPTVRHPLHGPRECPGAGDPEGHRRTGGGHQSTREADLLVLGATPVGHLGRTLGRVQGTGLILEVVEQCKQVVLPAHGRNLRTSGIASHSGTTPRTTNLWRNG